MCISRCLGREEHHLNQWQHLSLWVGQGSMGLRFPSGNIKFFRVVLHAIKIASYQKVAKCTVES